ncbi:GumC family protein [Thermaurantiacus sp.]
MNLIQFLRIFWGRKLLILATALTCLVVALGIASALPKRYPGTARLMFDTIRPDPVTGIGVGGREAKDFIRTQLEFIRDDRVAGAAVDRLGLVNDPATIAAYQASGFREEDGGIRRWLAGQIKSRTSAQMIAGSSIFEIIYEGPTPESARAVVGALRDAYVAETLRLKTDTAGRTASWYAEQAAKTKAELDALERQRSAFMAENNIVLTGGPGSPDAETAKLQTLQAALAAARANTTSQQVALAASAVTNPVADQLRVQLTAVEEEIARAGEQLGPAHPTYRSLLTRKRVIEQQLANALRQQGAGAAAIGNATSQTIAKLEAELAAQQKIVLQRKPVLDQLSLLDREVELKRAQYSRELASAEAKKLESEVKETSFVILGDPRAERTPSYPKLGQVAALATVFGLGLGVLGALFLEFAARRVRGPEDLVFATGAPLLASVGTPPASPLRVRMQRLLGRRERGAVGDGELRQAI